MSAKGGNYSNYSPRFNVEIGKDHCGLLFYLSAVIIVDIRRKVLMPNSRVFQDREFQKLITLSLLTVQA